MSVGKREATKSDRPQGSEAQCPVCWRVFTRDSVCEQHKTYEVTEVGEKGRVKRETVVCTDPAELGMQALERRGLTVWAGPPLTDEQRARLSERWAKKER